MLKVNCFVQTESQQHEEEAQGAASCSQTTEEEEEEKLLAVDDEELSSMQQQQQTGNNDDIVELEEPGMQDLDEENDNKQDEAADKVFTVHYWSFFSALSIVLRPVAF